MASRTGSLAALVGVVFVGMIGFGVFLPIFPFLAMDLGASPTLTTAAMGAYSLGQLIAAPFWGGLSDRIGRKPVLILGLLGNALAYLWLSHAADVTALAAARLFGGLMAGNVGAAFAAAADLSDDRTRARNMGLLGAAVGFGFIVGPALGGLFIGNAPERADFARTCLLSSGFAAVAALAALLLFRESLGRSERTTEKRRPAAALLRERPTLARFAAVMLVIITAQALMESTFGLFAHARLDWGPSDVGWALAGVGVGGVLLQGGVAGMSARRLGERLTLVLGLIAMAAGFAGLAMAHEKATLIAGLAALVIGIGLATPALNALIAEQAQEHDRGAVMGLSQSAAAMGRAFAPLGAGAVFEHFGVAAPFGVAAALALAALLLASGELAPARRLADQPSS